MTRLTLFALALAYEKLKCYFIKYFFLPNNHLSLISTIIYTDLRN